MNNIKIKNIINILFYCYFNRVYFLFNSYNFYKEIFLVIIVFNIKFKL